MKIFGIKKLGMAVAVIFTFGASSVAYALTCEKCETNCMSACATISSDMGQLFDCMSKRPTFCKTKMKCTTTEIGGG